MALTRTGPVWPSLAPSHTVLAALARALVLCCNGSGDIGAVSLCHLLATHVIMRVWPTAVHPRTGALMSRQALITPRASEVDCTVHSGPVRRQRGLVRPRLALSVHLLCISPSNQLPRAIYAGLFSLSCDPTNLLICPLSSPPQHLQSSRYAIPTQHSFPLTRQSTCTSIALSILCKTTFLTDLLVD